MFIKKIFYRLKKTAALCIPLLCSLVARLAKVAFFAAAAMFLVILLTNLIVIGYGSSHVVHDIDKLPPSSAALILGAKIYRGQLSPVLQDRVDAGIALKRAGIVEKLLLSGDHSSKYYDEVNSMKNYVLKNAPDIDAGDIFLDHCGFNTYDSIVRAKKIFCADSVVVVTQNFHIYRSVFFARVKGLKVAGYALSEDRYMAPARFSWQFREVFARVKAVFDVCVNRPPQILGEQYPLAGDGQTTWD